MLDFRKLFATKAPKPVHNAESSTAVSVVSSLYTTADFERYNPDDLIGRRGYAIYKKMMLDEQVKAAIKFKRDATTSRGFIFELDQSESGLSDKEMENRIYISEQYVDRIRGSWMDVLNFIMSAMYNGFSMTEMIFGKMEVLNKTWWTVDRFKLRPFDTMVFGTDKYGELQKLKQVVAGTEIQLDIRKFIHFVVNPDIDEFYGQSELREAYRAWFNKDAIIKFRNIWLERHAGGYTTITPMNGKKLNIGTVEYNNLVSMLSNMATSAGIILPENIEMKSNFPSNNVAFKEAIDDNDSAIARAILIPNLLGVSPQQKTGAYSQSQTQFEAFLWTLEADARRLEEALNEQLFRPLGEVNFGDQWFPRFKFKPISESKKIELLTLWKDMVSAGAVTKSETDEEHIRDMLDFPPVGEEINDTPDIEDEDEDEDEDDSDATGADTDSNDVDGKDTDTKTELEETVSGRGLVKISAFNKAMKRVDFAVIAETSESTIQRNTERVSEAVGTLLKDALFRTNYDELAKDISALSSIKMDSKLLAKLRSNIKSSMKEAWSLGAKHASREIDRAKGKRFNVDLKRMDFIESKFFDIKSFAIAGKLSDDALASIKNIILNGVKGDKTVKQVEQDIYRSFVRDGFITIDEAPEALAQALISDLEVTKGINVNKAHRIETMIRTNTFEAINEARYSYFTDPSLDGFVEALEYTSILDSRTTQICEHLDGHIHSTDSEVWTEYRPPNHFNCRSLLIPVTELDVWTESDAPTLEPQRGFE